VDAGADRPKMSCNPTQHGARHMPQGLSHDASRRLRTNAAADYLGLSKSLLEKDRVTGRLGIPFLKLGRAVVYDTRTLDEWLAGHARHSTSEYGS
jgi:hypothetical protein